MSVQPLRGAALVRRAREVAEVAHATQTDKAGNPYIDHPRRVAHTLAEDWGCEAQVVAAGWLHDVVEDTETTLADLLEAGFPVDVVMAVEAVTHRKGESRADFIARAAANPLARQVKLADVLDNADPKRLALIDDEATRERLRAKYARDLDALGWNQ